MTHDFSRLRTAEYLAIHPLGRVPSLHYCDRVLFETGAICEILCEKLAPDLWRAPGDPERCDWLQWLHFSETVAVHVAALTQQHIVLRDDADRSPLLMRLEARRLEKTLEVLNTALDGRRSILNRFSGADTSLGYAIWVAGFFTDLEAFEHVKGYLDAMQTRPAFQAALPGEGDPLIYRRSFYAPPPKPAA